MHTTITAARCISQQIIPTGDAFIGSTYVPRLARLSVCNPAAAGPAAAAARSQLALPAGPTHPELTLDPAVLEVGTARAAACPDDMVLDTRLTLQAKTWYVAWQKRPSSSADHFGRV